MRTESRVFGVVAAFLFSVAFLYAVLTGVLSGGYEPIGIIALALSGVLAMMISVDLWLISRRIPPRPEDRPDAERDEGAGDVGFFSPFSYWPAGVAFGAFLAALGVVLWELWLVGAGLLGVVAATAGMLFEYYTGSRRAAEH